MGKRTRDFAFVSLCYGRSGEEMCTGYAMAASGRMQCDYKQTNLTTILCFGGEGSGLVAMVPKWKHLYCPQLGNGSGCAVRTEP